MARNIDDIEKELMALPEQDRSRIALDLIRSLDNDDEPLSREEWEAAWLEEVRRREAEIDSGKATLVSHEELMASLKSVLRE
ncbi:addiction module protein [Thiohalophilus thiocyanatoxydans]|uniref:Putative addiction module component (TIGR02574 family) n=1 Tax=Thiohalophilus thiocyanatoxydans TaxID=381308 RepID=A0A4R8IG79_9GAMM|nr:addiction module protein [Thiohalophilus thiocyanatoxydans]TDX99560.1 putative addiction module component (TIGR02574 family) [Thiohalophilus thiocyanatoxydans]